MLMFMDDASILLGIIAVVFGLLPILLRSNAVYILLALCAGDLLATLASKDVTQIIGSTVNINGPVYSVVQITLLVVAPIILLFLYKKSAGSTFLLQLVAAAASVLVCFMLVAMSLPYDMQNNIQNSNLYLTVKPYFSVAIAAGLFVSLIYFWIKKPSRKKHGKKHKAL